MELVVIIIPPIVALIIGAWAVLTPRPADAALENDQLEAHIAWLEARLAYARERHWDEQMLANLHTQLAAARRKQAALAAR